jgi:RNA polymerase sigma-70 factor (ECF subfamily)
MKIQQHDIDEQSLIEAVQAEPARFAELYEQNFARIYAFFARRVATREEAQDLTAEVFHQALASIRKFTWQGAPFIAWLYGIAANVLASHWQKLGRHESVAEVDFVDIGPNIERSLQLQELVDSLSPDQRRVILRRFIHQRSVREIAQELGRSEGAIKQLQLRALENLREKLGRKR